MQKLSRFSESKFGLKSDGSPLGYMKLVIRNTVIPMVIMVAVGTKSFLENRKRTMYVRTIYANHIS